MKKILLAVVILLILWVESGAQIVNNSGSLPSDSIGLDCYNFDSLGFVPIGADSFYVVVTNYVGDSVFGERITTSSDRVDTSVVRSKPVYHYHAAVADIDGSGASGDYTLNVLAVNSDSGLTFLNKKSFQIYSTMDFDAWLDSAMTLVTYSGDSTNFVTLDSLIIYTLDSLFNRVPTDTLTEGYYATLLNKLDSLETAISDANLADKVWKVPFGFAFTAGSIGDSLTTASYVQGDAAGLTADGVWTYAINEFSDSTNQAGYYLLKALSLSAFQSKMDTTEAWIGIGAGNNSYTYYNEDVDTIVVTLSGDILGYILLYHPGGAEGQRPDTTKPVSGP